MPFRIVLHNDGDEEDYVRVQNDYQVPEAIHKLIKEKEDWRDGDSVIVFKVTDIEAKNEDFWEEMVVNMRKGQK